MNRYLQRSKELGLNGVLRRIYARSIGRLILLFQSLWWRLKTRKKMSNSSLLARTTGDWKTIDDLLMHLASRTASSFVLPHESPEETRRILEKHYPQHLSEILDAADAISKNQVNLAGHIFNYQADINWQQDPVTGLNWPILYRKRMGKYFNATRPVDLILFWKLNRHQNFISLGIAYWLTGDQRYVDSFIDQVQSWIKDNPLEHGNNLESFGFNECRFDFFNSSKDIFSYNLNDNSLVFKIIYKNFSMLFPGDILKLREKNLSGNSESGLSSNVMLAPHHGSSSSSTKIFLEKVHPSSVIISCGWHNRYGFPDLDVLKRLKERKIDMFRTDKNGAVMVLSDGKNYKIKSFIIESENE